MLLLLHGALGAGVQLEPLQMLLLDAVAMTFPGHAGTAAADFSIPGFAQAVLNFLDAQGTAQARIFGYSMGGYVALWLAAHHPDRVTAIATLGTKFDWTPATAAYEAAQLDPATLLAQVPKFAALLEARHGAAWREVLTNTQALMRGLGDAPAVTPAVLARVTCPVVVARGDADAMVSAAETEWAAHHLPHARLVTLPGVPHPIEKINGGVLADYIAAALG